MGNAILPREIHHQAILTGAGLQFGGDGSIGFLAILPFGPGAALIALDGCFVVGGGAVGVCGNETWVGLLGWLRVWRL